MSRARSRSGAAGFSLLAALAMSLFTGCDGNQMGGGTGGSGGSGGSGGGGAAAGGAGGAPLPEVLFAAGPEFNTWGIALSSDAVYFTDGQGPDGKVGSVPKAGGTMTVLAAGLQSPSPITVDATDVYFMDSHKVMKVPKTGGAVTTVAPAYNETYSAVVVDDDQIYWTNYGFMGSTMRMPKAGGAAVTVAPDAYPAGMVVTGGTMYWSAMDADAIKSAPILGGPVTIVASGQNGPRWGIAANADHLFWVNEGTFPMQIWSAPLDGSGPPVQIGVSPVDGSGQTSLVADDVYVYFKAYLCKIVRIPVGGGAALVTDVDMALGCPRFMAGDVENLYYTSDAGITKYPKSAL